LDIAVMDKSIFAKYFLKKFGIEMMNEAEDRLKRGLPRQAN